VVGNPPFLGQRFQVRELGESYTKSLRGVYKEQVSGNVDLVCYWFVKALKALKHSGLGAAGFVTTNSIRGGDNRAVLTQIIENYEIFNAWADEPWVNEGAAVRVSLICFGHVTEQSELDGLKVDDINSDLTASKTDDNSCDLTTAVTLAESTGAAFSGFKMNGSFDVPMQTALEWLSMPNPHGKSNADVLHPYANAKDLTTRSRNQWVIYFPKLTENEASLYEKPFEWASRYVKEARQEKREEHLRQKWWLHERPRPELRNAVSSLNRFIATPMVSKHRLFAWLPTVQLPENAAIVIARSDDATFGVLHSRFHELWSLRMCTWMGKGNDPRYTPTTCFETFPFPAGLTPQDTASQQTRRLASGAVVPDVPSKAAQTASESIAEAAHKLTTLRDNWLNPPDWVQRLPEVVPLGMATSPYPDRIVPKPGHEKELSDRTLTKLYNARPAWLAAAHAALDQAVATAYGWTDYTPEMADEVILQRLLALNVERSVERSGEK
jgi:type II restriction/modification system DNA methylase subunit YeeA